MLTKIELYLKITPSLVSSLLSLEMVLEVRPLGTVEAKGKRREDEEKKSSGRHTVDVVALSI